MNSQTTLPISEARKKIFEIANEVQKPSTYFTLTEKGRPKVVIMSVEEFESWAETLEVIKDFPDLKMDIEEARRDFKTGNYLTLEEFLAKEGYVLRDKGKVKYRVPPRNSQKSSKRIKKS